jgi:hypothetical protein
MRMKEMSRMTLASALSETVNSTARGYTKLVSGTNEYRTEKLVEYTPSPGRNQDICYIGVLCPVYR